MKSFHIACYVFQADIVCCDCIANWAKDRLMEETNYSSDTIEEIVQDGGEAPNFDTGVFAYRSETLLRMLAPKWKINLEDEYSYDSDNFPKIVFADQVEDREYCGVCHEEIP